MLSNFQLGEHALLQMFLLGQPEFRGTIANAPETEQLRQRVIANHHLEAMLPEEVEPYIIHRLGLVGWREDPVIAPDVYPAIWTATGGIPRKVNMLLSRLFLHGAVEELHELAVTDVEAVVEELQIATRQPSLAQPSVLADVAFSEVASAQADGLKSAPQPDVETLTETLAEPASRPLANAIAIADPRLERQITAQAADITALRAELAGLDRQCRDQDAAIRRVLTLLIDWAERDPDAPSVARGFAA